jgi:hypothetical protein
MILIGRIHIHTVYLEEKIYSTLCKGLSYFRDTLTQSLSKNVISGRGQVFTSKNRNYTTDFVELQLKYDNAGLSKPWKPKSEQHPISLRPWLHQNDAALCLGCTGNGQVTVTGAVENIDGEVSCDFGAHVLMNGRACALPLKKSKYSVPVYVCE